MAQEYKVSKRRALVPDGLRVDRHDRVAVLVIDRPEVRNAVDPATLEALASALDEASADPPATVRRIRHLMTVTAVRSAEASAAAMADLGTSEQLRKEMADGMSRFLGGDRG
jgi:1,4-dihydroxy-2-naphthoyl-CoA synthase